MICVVKPIIVRPLFRTMYSREPTMIFSKRTFAPPENRHTAKYQCNQDLGLKLVTTGRSNRTNLDNIDKCGKSCDRTASV